MGMSTNWTYLKLDCKKKQLLFFPFLIDSGFNHLEQEFPYNKGRTYDFVSTAGAQIRDSMTTYLTGILPGIDGIAQQQIRSSIETLFTYNSYKNLLNCEGQNVANCVNMLIFVPGSPGYVAHVNISCNTIRGAGTLYTVYTNITCQKYTWFDFQQIPLTYGPQYVTYTNRYV